MANIAINGPGRIGRAALKLLEQADGAEAVAVNDLIPPDNRAYLLRYDTVSGRWHKALTADGAALTVGGRKIPVLAGDRYHGILGVADDPVVSAGIIGDSRASVVDAAMTRVVDGTLVKVMSWYDNEWGFACQMVREAFAVLGLPAPDLSQARP